MKPNHARLFMLLIATAAVLSGLLALLMQGGAQRSIVLADLEPTVTPSRPSARLEDVATLSNPRNAACEEPDDRSIDLPGPQGTHALLFATDCQLLEQLYDEEFGESCSSLFTLSGTLRWTVLDRRNDERLVQLDFLECRAELSDTEEEDPLVQDLSAELEHPLFLKISSAGAPIAHRFDERVPLKTRDRLRKITTALHFHDQRETVELRTGRVDATHHLEGTCSMQSPQPLPASELPEVSWQGDWTAANDDLFAPLSEAEYIEEAAYIETEQRSHGRDRR